ncbi:OmpH family outer membrane protein [Desulfolithobacter sp.]
MKKQAKLYGIVVAVVWSMALVLLSGGQSVQAAAVKIGVVNVQKVLMSSDAGKEAQIAMEEKVKELQNQFRQEEEALLSLQKEIEKKSSVWSDDIKQEKIIELNKKRRNLQLKQEDANMELKRLREKKYGPILKKLEQVVKDVAQKKGYAVVLPRNAVLYYSDAIDMTDDTVKALNRQLKK